MRKVVKAAGVLSLLAAGLSFSGQASADTSTCAQYGSVQPGVNPSFQHINCLLTEEALKQEVPPEVVKAVAMKENAWKQFDENGDPIVSEDGGIGLMQLTNQSQFNTELLKTDIVYNIEKGVTILDQMFDSNVPKISDDRDIIENWYFPVMAYNGIKPVNSPVKQSTGEKNTDAYQEQVFAMIKNDSFLDEERSFADFGFKPEDFQYDPEKTDNIVFKKMTYTPTGKLNQTVYNLQKGDQAVTLNTPSLRSIPGGGAEEVLEKLPEGALLTVTGSFEYDKNPNSTRQFVWYPVRTAAGKTGFVSSAYLEKSDKPAAPLFKDVSANYRFYNDIAALSSQSIISGYPDGTFKPGSQVTRGEATTMVVRALGLPTNGMKPIEVAEKQGIINGYRDGRLAEKDPVTRAQVAIILTNAFNLKETVSISFTDVHSRMAAYDSIRRVVAAGIAYGDNNKFNPDKPVTRGELAAFLNRTLER
ncbi:S-layer homology domain-containing protein [Domibacillus sp. DTU_2020_1001157_1_SI_ALB_TIR_016]|uniref:S-layer homology domain-containing protein n=1 Tax=Domibacillus sp. DTU_2020_1001157_1_SI_ALB_TIR_016 TaxID=3077789 RepID=UPI0028E30056|nr:S-layer homology domain-containing protein [Domibacillus sp. DTU_2020_1001157_1_SI_ALB_TIR_016]WNS82235.1 S-layer homology domain-containing protein [Domibacillus sp. DTU_2020_1001157_1_SI_ALB_TIR_016]